MKLTYIRTVIAAAAMMLSAACAGGITEVNGPVTVNKAYTVTTERPWNKFSDSMDGARTRGDILTQDGPALNTIRLVGGLKPGQYIVKPARKEFPTPTYESDMTELELVEFMTDTMTALGYQQVETADVVPLTFAGQEGVGMSLSAVTTRGLTLQGEARLARSGDRLNAALFMAPARHYYDAYKDEVARLLDSAAPSGG